LRSGKQLEGPKGAKVKGDGKKNHDESERSKEPKSPSLKPYIHPCLFH